MLDDQMDKLCNNSKVLNQTNQLQTQIMMERCSPLLKQEHPKHVHLLTAELQR